MVSKVQFPIPGCVVEFLEDNVPKIAFILEENSGKYRLFLPNRKEVKLSSNRLLPWVGPLYSTNQGKEEIARILMEHKNLRDNCEKEISPLEVWELVSGEIQKAPAGFFAELFANEPDIDVIAAFGHALLNCKSHFRFQPPEFIVYDAEVVSNKEEAKKQKETKEALIADGTKIIKNLWEIISKKQPESPNENLKEELSPPLHFPEDIFDSDLLKRVEKMLFMRMSNASSDADANFWDQIVKGIPDAPFLPLQLLTAWQKIPPHYNFWLDRADYQRGDSWWLPEKEIVDKQYKLGKCEICPENPALPELNLPFVSIDGPETVDIDDAFYIEDNENGWDISLAFACPALDWPFGGDLDKKIAQRSTSIYLPEGDLHMLPEKLGTDAFSLLENQERPVFCIDLKVDKMGEIKKCKPFLAKTKIQANLRFHQVQKFYENPVHMDSDNPASKFAKQLNAGLEFAKLRQNKRIKDGAVIFETQQPKIILRENKDNSSGFLFANPLVEIRPEPLYPDARLLVAECMVIASEAIADWAFENRIPLIYRSQNIQLPKDQAGIWQNPAQVNKILRSFAPSLLDVEPLRHAALGIDRYAPITSPLRRYVDFINEAQILSFLYRKKLRWEKKDLSILLTSISRSLDSANAVQKNRPRYWKLLYFKQQGEQVWRDGIVVEENESFVNVNLPEFGINIKGKRHLFDERVMEGNQIRVRIGNINPLYNEISVVEADSGF